MGLRKAQYLGLFLVLILAFEVLAVIGKSSKKGEEDDDPTCKYDELEPKDKTGQEKALCKGKSACYFKTLACPAECPDRKPENDVFAHLETQFKFKSLTDQVEGVLGKTYRPDYVSPVKKGVAMPMMGGEDKYHTTSLHSTSCQLCVFKRPAEFETSEFVFLL